MSGDEYDRDKVIAGLGTVPGIDPVATYEALIAEADERTAGASAEISFNFELTKGQIIEISRLGAESAVYRVVDVHRVGDTWVWTYDLEPLEAAEREPDGI